LPVDIRRFAAGDAADDVLDFIGAGKSGAAPGWNIKGLEAVKQIVAASAAQFCADLHVRAGERLTRSDRAVGGDLGEAN